VIPGGCVFSIDLRAAEDSVRDRAEAAISQALRAAAALHKTEIAIRRTHSAPATACDSRLQTHLADAVKSLGLPVLSLPSGAGHDAMAMAAICPVGMLFVRCAGGISHHPDEAVTESDVTAALDAMTVALRNLDPSGFLRPD
jgi:acetylornithine deacetylase/succinyl-diaminopimelate desuccinylase-like protein